MRSWARRTAALHDELVALADFHGGDPRWWLVAGGAALAWAPRAAYLASDAEPAADTFLGWRDPPPADAARDAVARALAARAAIRALDGTLPDQPLAVTIRRTAAGAAAVASALDVAAFAVGDRTWCAPLADPDAIAADLASVLADEPPRVLRPLAAAGATPFVSVTLGDEPLESARHGHRRAWRANGESVGPWLGLSRAGGLAVVSTCHMVVDGYGHALLASKIAASLRTAIELELRGDQGPRTEDRGAPNVRSSSSVVPCSLLPSQFALPLAWRELASPLRALPLAYATGLFLHRLADRRDSPRSPTFQIPVAPGAAGDPARRARRVVPALASVHFEAGVPEPFARFAERARAAIAREADGSGLVTRLMAAARAAPTPLAWKRRAIGATRPRWLAPVADVLGGRACVSRIRIDEPLPATCAVSSPAAPDGLVVTAVDDGAHAALTLCGAGATPALLDELLALVPSD
ncbi:MAG TPA: hypothetical protein VMJ10_12900 [Kofleriaceae bacterium]|nr:hypothetical protein [Kofleriaceae bacterium]